MPYILDLLYLTALSILSPWLLYKAWTTGKYRRGVWRKLTGQALLREWKSPCVWFHGVSVGEIHLLRQIVDSFRRRHPDWECVISTTTDTGFDEACKHFAGLKVFYWPFDFSWAVRRALERVRPSLVVLAESELWPNFLTAARQRGVPVAVVNGRISPRSIQRYRWLRPLFSRLLTAVDLFAVQTEEYAACLRQLGAAPQRIAITGSVKFDGAETDRANLRTQDLGRLLGLRSEELVWIGGSTQAPEEEVLLDIYRRLKPEYPRLRLVLVPRQKERFEKVARLVRGLGLPLVRRSKIATPAGEQDAIILVDTIGELAALWGLADLAFVGGSLDGRRGGQNMIEPAAYGAAVVFGPHVWNFRDTANRLTAAGAAILVKDPVELEQVVRRLLDDPVERQRLGEAAQGLVLGQQGANQRTLEALERLLEPRVVSVRSIAV